MDNNDDIFSKKNNDKDSDEIKKTMFRLYIVGGTGCGKSFLIKQILWQTKHTHKWDAVFLICTTMKEQKIYTKEIKFKKDHTSENATDEQLQKFWDEIKKNKEKGKKSLLIIDDCLYTELSRINSLLSEFVTKCRHWYCSLIIVGQLYKGFSPAIRLNCQYKCLFHTDNQSELKKMEEELGNTALEKFQEFTNVKYGYLWINGDMHSLDEKKYTNNINFGDA